LSLSSTSPDTSINILLEYIGKALKAERIYIFEFKNDQIMDNTYEWCAKDVIPQIDNLQDVPQEIAAIWIERFKDNKNVIIEHLEDTKESDPAMYDLLLPQEIDSLIVSPLIFNNKIIGFFGVDNPPKQLMQNISTLFMILGHFIMSLLRRRDLVMRLEKLSYYDQLTGFKNRHGMDEYISSMNKAQSIGVIYGDVTGLKRVNDTLGHKEGDKLLVRSCDCLKRIFSSDELFRIGGDEFLILCSGITEEELINKINLLRTDLQEHDVVMAIGYIWRPHNDDNIDKLLSEADKMMYKDKRDYYKKLV
jgi:diguanylate cyclase (GGDEF)-like protein